MKDGRIGICNIYVDNTEPRGLAHENLLRLSLQAQDNTLAYVQGGETRFKLASNLLRNRATQLFPF